MTSVTVVEVADGSKDYSTSCPGLPLAQRINLRAADAREWRYFVNVSGRPLDQVQVGDQLDLTVSGSGMFFDQTVVLGRASELVLFTRVTYVSGNLDLSAYGTIAKTGPAYCISPSPCIDGSKIVEHYSLLVTQGTDSVELRNGGPTKVGDLLFTVEDLYVILGAQCDPPWHYRYGAFRPR